MKKKPIIGILGVPTTDEDKDSLIALYNPFKNIITEKNAIPFMICPFQSIEYNNTEGKKIPALTEEEKKYYEQIIDMCDGILIQGGYRMYDFHKYVVNYAIKKDIPILGICIGMQLLACIDNNCYSLLENNTEINHKQRNIKYCHKVNIVPNTKLYKIIDKSEIEVNSSHKYHVEKVNNLIVSAYSSDGLIEAVEFPDKKYVIGVQWHPEKMTTYDEYANKIFDSFINECQKN